ncbi:NTP transferase domain-containing protein [Helicobacter himalayensis]|uniref:NTP transferase domain-containing protein n=1 Tax=Helicobacter himalayensis TaxID=1591088 RepID=UPI0008335567|nr:NTP transferase domain-containing protein [Helicobacter himalayensis]
MQKISSFPCVILCGGKSSRMGCDKALLPFDANFAEQDSKQSIECEARQDFRQNSLTQFVYNNLSEWFERVFLCVKSKDSKLLEYNLPTIIESRVLQENALDCTLNIQNLAFKERFSPLYGIFCALEFAQKHLDAQYVAFVSVDTPFINPMHFENLATLSQQKNYKVAYITQILENGDKKEHFLLSLWHMSMKDTLLNALKNKDFKIGVLIKNTMHTSLEIKDNALSFNLNTKETYHNALKFLQSYATRHKKH